MKMDEIKVGFIGCGGMAGVHVGILSKIEGVHLTSFCDLVEERAGELAQRFKGKAYTDHHRMLDKERLDALYICLPPFAHKDQELLAVERRIPFFIEKPVGLNLEEVRRVAERVVEERLLTSVGYHWRYSDTTQRAKEMLKEERIALLLGYWIGNMPGVPWWRDESKSGGQVVEQTTHIFDLARYLVGEVKSLYSISVRGLVKDIEDYSIDDASTVAIEFNENIIGNISSTHILSHYDTVGIKVFCIGSTLECWSERLKVVKGKKVEEWKSKVNPNIAEDEAFIKAVRTGDDKGILCSYGDGVKTLELTIAANRSMKTGEVVSLPLN